MSLDARSARQSHGGFAMGAEHEDRAQARPSGALALLAITAPFAAAAALGAAWSALSQARANQWLRDERTHLAAVFAREEIAREAERARHVPRR